MPYAVAFKASALKEVEKLPPAIARKVLVKAAALADDPRPSGCAKLAGADNLWRVRIGRYRIVYVVDDTAQRVDVRIVAHRRDVYRGL
ncbi:MAG: mRNA interferase RelE/StbE [Phycisphaerales bacterium]|jgi:mRNA interferase RelE/StbE|nr:mRNA interferase RelE/StbE [Phycisphaerales bacterium]